jgi:hypothetical protein
VVAVEKVRERPSNFPYLYQNLVKNVILAWDNNFFTACREKLWVERHTKDPRSFEVHFLSLLSG